MRIEPVASGADIAFRVVAEDANDRVLLTMFTDQKGRSGQDFVLHSSSYETNFSATASLLFGWRRRAEAAT